MNFSKLIPLIKTKISREVNIKLSQLISPSICRSKMMYLAWILIFYFIETCDVMNNPLTPQIVDEQGDQMSIPPPPPENTADWVNSFIFEPMKAICLTQSTFKVTTYIDFAPYLETFQTVHDYLQDFKNDLDDPSYLQYLTYGSRLINSVLLHNDSLMREYLASPDVKLTLFLVLIKSK